MRNRLINSVATAALLGLATSVLADPALADPALADDEVKLELGGNFIGSVAVFENELSDIGDALLNAEDYRFDGETVVRFEGVSALDGGLRYGFKAEIRVSDEVGKASATTTTADMLEQAYLFVDGGFGRVEVGQSDGVADQFSVRSPHALNNMSVSPGRSEDMVDPLALAPVGTVLDGSAEYTKFSYMTPSFRGLKLGVSFTPDARPTVPAFTVGDSENGDDIVEFGVIYSRDFEALSLDMSATYLSADATPITGEVEEWNAGVNVGFRGLSVGGSYRESGSPDNTGLQKYEAYDVGVAYETGPWKISAQYAEHEGELAGAPMEIGHRYLISARYKVAKGLRIGAGFQRDLDVLTEEEGSAFILESALKF